MSPQQQESVEVRLEDAEPGMILASPAKDPEKKEALLPEGTKLTQERIEALKRRNIFVLDVTEESREEVESDGDTVGVDFSDDELEQLAEDVLEEHEEEEEEREDERREFYQEAINFTRVLFDDIQKERGFDVDDVRETIESMIQLLGSQQEETLKMTRIRNDNNYLLSHTVNVALLALHIGRELDFSRNELIEMGVGCMIHDIGMADIPDKLLDKQGPLTDREYEVIQKHPLFREELLNETDDLSYFARSVVLQHHERMDGTGYPEGLENGEISKLARVVAVADSYEAMVSPRVYRQRKTSYEAMQIIIQEAGTKYWEKAARYFYQSMAIYPIGSVVELNTGEVGVVHQSTDAPMRPKIKIIVDEDGENPERPPIVNMIEDQGYFIEDVLDEVDV